MALHKHAPPPIHTQHTVIITKKLEDHFKDEHIEGPQPAKKRALLRKAHEDHFRITRALTERMRNLYGVHVGRKTINNTLVARGYPVCRILRKPLLTSSTVRRTLPARLQGWQGPSWRVQDGGSVHVWGAFHRGAKSPLVLLDRNVNGVVHRDILWDTLVPFARQHFGDDFRYQDDNATPHHSRVMTDYLQQEDITKMDQPANPLTATSSSMWGELGRAINNLDHPAHNPHELWQTLLDQWANIPVGRLQRLVASMPHRLAAIIRFRGGNKHYNATRLGNL